MRKIRDIYVYGDARTVGCCTRISYMVCGWDIAITDAASSEGSFCWIVVAASWVEASRIGRRARAVVTSEPNKDTGSKLFLLGESETRQEGCR